MKILDVILKEDAPIIQGTNWTKTWLDWDEIPDLVVKNNPAAYSDAKGTLLPNAVEVAKTNLDAWRRANPGKFPEEAWTYLRGKGPIPTPSKQMPGRDLRSQPPDDSGTWIDSGNYWVHTIPPFISAIKPDNRNPATWGPKGGNTSYVPVEKQIAQFREENPKITDQEIEAKLRALPGTGTVGGKMYSNREIAAGIEKARTIFAFNKKEKDAEKEAKEEEKKAKKERQEQLNADKQFKKNKTCPIGFQVNDDEDGCERVPNKPAEGEKPPAPVTVTPPTVDPTIPVNGACGAGYKLNADKTKCEKDETVTTPAGNVSMIWPAGNKKLLTDKFGARDGKHRGIDIQLPYGSKIVAPEDGTVIAEGIQEGLAGLLIQLKSKDGRRVHTFMHLSVSSPVGRSATQGQFIAESGGEKRAYTKKDKDGKDLIGKDGKPVIVPEKDDKRAGLTTGAHLHWGLEVDGVYVNPLDYVDKK
jgi:murein DD-endopeptidase MepM/ murein hydrolase activator NlpD